MIENFEPGTDKDFLEIQLSHEIDPAERLLFQY